MRAHEKAEIRRRLLVARVQSGNLIGVPRGAKWYARQLRHQQALGAVQKWPGRRRLFLEGAVLRPAQYRTALRDRG